MKGFWILRAIKILLMVIIAVIVFGFVTMHLWNWLMPALFGLKVITFAQALGLVVLSKILFGGIHRHGPGRGFRHGFRRSAWKRQMQERWAQMSPEERERFRVGMKMRWGCGPGRRGPWNSAEEPAKEQA